MQKIPNVHFLPKQDVIRLVTNPEQTVVTGVSVRERGQIGQEETLFADMVFDTSGRTSKLAKWLEDLGYNVPEPDLLKVSLGYSTRRYMLASHQIHLTNKWDVINIAGQPANGTFTGVFSFIENHVAEVLLYRPGGCYPPVNAEEFELEISQLPSPLISEIVKELEPITPPRGFHVSELHRHHFEEMKRWPSGLLVLGDAFCIFDPIFGQGMTVAAMEAELLEICLQEQKIDPKPNFEQRVFRKLQKVIEPAWWLNCACDLQWQGVEYVSKAQLEGIDFAKRYMDLFLKHATIQRNFELYGLYWAVNTLSLPPSEIMNSKYYRWFFMHPKKESNFSLSFHSSMLCRWTKY